MPFYQKRGLIPAKKHTVFPNPNFGIYYEELISREGFSDIFSNPDSMRILSRDYLADKIE